VCCAVRWGISWCNFKASKCEEEKKKKREKKSKWIMKLKRN